LNFTSMIDSISTITQSLYSKFQKIEEIQIQLRQIYPMINLNSLFFIFPFRLSTDTFQKTFCSKKW
jgi:hypothetical protein